MKSVDFIGPIIVIFLMWLSTYPLRAEELNPKHENWSFAEAEELNPKHINWVFGLEDESESAAVSRPSCPMECLVQFNRLMNHIINKN